MSPLVLAVSYFFHLIATVVWVGGLVMLVILVLPEARRVMGEDSTLYAFLARIRKRFLPLSHFSLVVLTVTGLIQMAGNPNYDGLLAIDNDWSRAILLKHIAVFGMLICGLTLQLGVAPALERASLLAARGKGDPDDHARLHRRESRLTWINVGLGILTLAFTAWATAI